METIEKWSRGFSLLGSELLLKEGPIKYKYAPCWLTKQELFPFANDDLSRDTHIIWCYSGEMLFLVMLQKHI